jgi:hypothetical protein
MTNYIKYIFAFFYVVHSDIVIIENLLADIQHSTFFDTNKALKGSEISMKSSYEIMKRNLSYILILRFCVLMTVDWILDPIKYTLLDSA